jgi:hypothetical protein
VAVIDRTPERDRVTVTRLDGVEDHADRGFSMDFAPVRREIRWALFEYNA